MTASGDLALARNPSQFVNGRIRLSPNQGRLLGFSGRARRYADPATYAAVLGIEAADSAVRDALNAIERASLAAATISSRAYEQARNLVEFGEPLTKEQRTKRLQRHPLEYRSQRARETARYQRRARQVRAIIPGIAPKDAKLIDRKQRENFNSWSDKDKLRFRQLFAAYPREQVLEALGSPITK